MIVMKFGGSSVESAGAILRVAGIVKKNLGARPAVVVSAIGKTTNRLLHIAEFAAKGDGVTAWRKLLALQADHLQISAKLGLSLDHELERLFGELRGDILEIASLGSITPELWACVASFGERLSSLIVGAAFEKCGIPARHIDARTLILTDGNHQEAKPLTIESYAKIRRAIPCANRELVPVLGGFIASTEDGSASTLGRGGSDYTASLIGAAINAEEIQIWTDVDGMLTCDPRLMEGAQCLETISYEEAERMARLGAKVLHPETVLPARKLRVPISIRNSRNPSHPGTTINASASAAGVVKSIAAQTDRGLVCLVGTKIASEADRAAKALWTCGVPAALNESSDLSIIFHVPQEQIGTAAKVLHQEFFRTTTRLVFGRTTTQGRPSPCFAAS
jgi:aspartate kinase